MVFVLGAPRSGTTLLQRVLSVHGSLFSLHGETGLFSYQNIFDPRRAHFELPPEQRRRMLHEASDLVDFFDRGVALLSARNGGRRFVEKTPQHVLHLQFILAHFPNAKVIHAVRDGRDCYCSSKAHRGIPQNTSARRFARYWRRCIRAAIPYEQHDRVFTVQYEQFVGNPRRCLREIMDFLGMDMQEAQLDLAQVGADQRARLDEFKRLSQTIDAASVGRWKTELGERELREFERIAGGELSRYGYQPACAPAAEAMAHGPDSIYSTIGPATR
ncbi:MAG: sulfotransferase [Pseudomonadota bacterium]